MPRPNLSEEEIAAFRRKALRSATKLFAKYGYAGVTMRAIAADMRTSAMTAYRYFRNKAEIFALVRSDAERRFMEPQRAILDAGGNAFERLIRMREQYVRFALDNPDAYRVMFEVRAEGEADIPEASAALRDTYQIMVQMGELFIECGLASGDPVTVSHLMWAQTHGLLSLHFAGRLRLARSLDQLLIASSEIAARRASASTAAPNPAPKGGRGSSQPAKRAPKRRPAR